MKLKKKYSINFIIVFFMTTSFLLFYLITQLNYDQTIKKNYYKLEETENSKTMYHFDKLVKHKIFSQEQILEDYAIWDDTYNNIENSEWINKEIINWLNIHFSYENVIIFDNDFNIKYSNNAPDNLAYNKISNIVKNSKDQTLTHFEKCNETIGLISTTPITPTNDRTKKAGYLVIVTDVTKTFQNEFSSLYGYKISIDFNNALSSNSINNKDELISKYSIENIDGQSIAVLNIHSNRNLLQQILVIESKYKSLQVAILIAILILSHIFMKLTIINPIKRLENNITSLDTNTYNYLYEDFYIDDINRLVRAFNSLMYKILYFENEIENLVNSHRLDPLTKLGNRETFDKYIYHKNFDNLSIIFIDIDNFKLINDYHGHSIGDIILKEVAKTIKLNLTHDSKAFRYGGEEFVITVYGNKIDAFSIAENIRTSILESNLIQNYQVDKPISISCGISNLPSDSSDIDEVIIFADKAMYSAKQNGKNKTSYFRKSLKNINHHFNLDFNLDYIIALSNAIDSKIPFKENHSKFVSEYAYLIGVKLGFSESELENLKIGGLIHDIGKISISDKIFSKKGPLNYVEKNIVTNHPKLGYNIMSNATSSETILSCVRDHHERPDGNGFPRQLKEDEITIYASIISVVNSYHTMISDLPYKEKLTHEEAIKELIDNKGTQFDSTVVDIFVALLD
ncbi:MAG: diguanylate cyclase [Nitrososphaeraceae archaeon]